MRIYIAEELSNSIKASDKKYFKSKARGYDLFFAKQVAQTALASIFSFYRGIIKIDNLKNKKKWIGDPIRKSLSTLENKHVVLIGTGSINKVFTKYIQPFGCNVESFNTNSKNRDLMKHLKKAELVISALPGTEKTTNYFNKSKLNALNKKCIFVNVGRGNTVDEKHLIQILQENKIRGAALDVTKEEPLKKDSALWSLKNVILTQHTGGGSENETKGKIDFFLSNLKKFKINKNKLINKVNLSKGY